MVNTKEDIINNPEQEVANIQLCGIPSMAIIRRKLSMLSLVVISATIIVNSNTSNAKKSQFSSILIFGDSTVDTGNNNFIPVCPVRANFPPYGKDFPGHKATGRFCNGRLLSDLVADILDIRETVRPYFDPRLTDRDLLTGVNFASSGSGIDDWTMHAVFVVPLSQQVEHFKNYRKRLKKVAGEEDARRMLKNAFVLISSGNNDFGISFYDMPARSIEFGFNASRYQDFLLQRLQSIIEELHELGLRRIAMTGLIPLGCLPFQITLHKVTRSCVSNHNSDSRLYNRKLKKLLSHLQRQLPGSRIVYADIYTPMIDMVNNPEKYDLKVVDMGCCGTGLVEFGPLCNVLTPTCDDASKYLFWDANHPSEAANLYIAQYFKKHVIPKFKLQH